MFVSHFSNESQEKKNPSCVAVCALELVPTGVSEKGGGVFDRSPEFIVKMILCYRAKSNSDYIPLYCYSCNWLKRESG